MNFEYDETQQKAIAGFRAFCRDEVMPADAELDGLAPDEAGTRMRKLFGKVASAGGAAWSFPESVGGKGRTRVDEVAHWESIGAASPSLMVALDASVSLCARAILLFGSNEQKRRYLPDLLGGRRVGAFAVTEWSAGSDVSMIETTAEADGEGWIVSGRKAMITNAPYADVIVLAAKTSEGRSMLVTDAGAPGLVVGDAIPTMGLHGAPIGELSFEGCRLAKDALLGAEGKANEILDAVTNAARVTFAAGCIGVSMRILEESFRYANERTAFGKPLFKNQEFSFKLADMRLLTDGARLLTQYTAWMMDQGAREVPSLAACAKLFASESATWIANAGLSVFGGMGYLKQYAIERLYRDARYLEIGLGAPEYLRGMIARTEMEPYQ